MKTTRWIAASRWGDTALAPLLRTHPAVGVRGVLARDVAQGWAAHVLAADDVLVRDFGGEQQSLGRAFYTHLETGQSRDYFRDATSSDALVERVVPGMQAFVLALLARLLGGAVRRRHGFCGPGVHVFPPGEHVARRGGVYHYDLEGLSPLDRVRRPRAVSLVLMLQAPQTRGGLGLFARTWRGSDWPCAQRPGFASTVARSRAGDVVLFSSYRLHQIQAFGGPDARVSATCHAIEADAGAWDVWF